MPSCAVPLQYPENDPTMLIRSREDTAALETIGVSGRRSESSPTTADGRQLSRVRTRSQLVAANKAIHCSEGRYMFPPPRPSYAHRVEAADRPRRCPRPFACVSWPRIRIACFRADIGHREEDADYRHLRSHHQPILPEKTRDPGRHTAEIALDLALAARVARLVSTPVLRRRRRRPAALIMLRIEAVVLVATVGLQRWPCCGCHHAV